MGRSQKFIHHAMKIKAKTTTLKEGVGEIGQSPRVGKQRAKRALETEGV
jgi:hypothetical protein